MPTTSNFGWTTPADTDLVKDGAAAIRTLGNGIDTSFVDLKGGTTGQVLSKNTNTDLDFTWVTPNDADAIQNTIVDAKGDLISATAADTPARLAVGTNGQVLTADSTTATGLKWATPASSSGPAFRAYRSGSNFVPAEDTWTKIAFQTESFDTDSKYDTGTYEFTPGQAGYYYFTIHTSLNTNAVVRLAIYKNGSNVQNSLFNPGNEMIMTTDFLYSDADDYFSAYIYMDSSTARTVDYGEGASFWAAHFVRS